MRSYLFAAIPVVLSVGLLVALRVNVPAQQSAHLLNGSEAISRGQDLQTTATGVKAYAYGSSIISLAENTTLTLEDASTSTPRLAMREGRIVTEGPVDISVRDTTIHANGTVTFVFYSWLDKLDVIDITNKEQYSVDTLHNVKTAQVYNFDPATSSAKSFYEWALD